MVDMMKGLNDYRLFYYAEPAEALASNRKILEAYSGVDPVMENGKAQGRMYRRKNIQQLIADTIGLHPENRLKPSAFEVQFILARLP